MAPVRTFQLKKNDFAGIGGNCAKVISPDKLNLYIDENLTRIYHRPNLCLKVFLPKYPLDFWMEHARWSNEKNGFSENLLECSKIQNILAFQGYSPRVYDLVFLQFGNIKYAAQVTDYIDQNHGDINVDRIKKFCEEIGIAYHDIENDGANMRGGLFVDTQEFQFLPEYEQGLIGRLHYGLTYAGDHVDQTGIVYQDVKELGLSGRRVNNDREKLIQIDAAKLPKNFTVLDYGCNGAYFLRQAFDKGAGYAMGVDVARVNDAAKELNNYLGYFNMDFQEQIPTRQFDLVLLLAAFTYGLGKLDQIFSLAPQALIEGHCFNNQHTEEYYQGLLKPYYKKITTLGWVKDDPDLPPRVVMKGER